MTHPPGYERLLLGHAIAVARSDVAPSIRRSLVGSDGKKSTLYDFAHRHPSARPLQGRGTAYAVPLPQSAMRVVVRHNSHGGLFAPITRDLFLPPTRAPYELEVSFTLRRLRVPTPEIIAYAIYPPGGLLQRSDVCSREIPAGRDLADILNGHDAGERAAALASTAQLIADLARAGARHHDLNAKNVLLAEGRAYVLDVDRVTFGANPEAALNGNLARLERSLRKWRDQFDMRVSNKDIGDLGIFAGKALRG